MDVSIGSPAFGIRSAGGGRCRVIRQARSQGASDGRKWFRPPPIEVFAHPEAALGFVATPLGDLGPAAGQVCGSQRLTIRAKTQRSHRNDALRTRLRGFHQPRAKAPPALTGARPRSIPRPYAPHRAPLGGCGGWMAAALGGAGCHLGAGRPRPLPTPGTAGAGGRGRVVAGEGRRRRHRIAEEGCCVTSRLLGRLTGQRAVVALDLWGKCPSAGLGAGRQAPIGLS